MRLIAFAGAVLAVAVSGCALMPEAEKGIWVRSDGQSGRTNPALAAQFQTDSNACRRGGGIDRNCMAGKGYVLVPESQAATKAAELRAASGVQQPAPPPAPQ